MKSTSHLFYAHNNQKRSRRRWCFLSILLKRYPSRQEPSSTFNSLRNFSPSQSALSSACQIRAHNNKKLQTDSISIFIINDTSYSSPMSTFCEKPSARTCNPSLNFYCPEGGTWHVCANSTIPFLGCCMIDPCAMGCPAGALYPASFNPAIYGAFRDSNCSGGPTNFWTCPVTSPTFLGCCASNPCSNGGQCPREDLSAAYLNADIGAAQLQLFLGIESNTAGPPYIAAAPDVANTPPTWAVPHDSKLSRGSIAGIINGSMAVFLIIAVLATIFRFKLVRKQNPNRTLLKIPSTIDAS
jgi:hypothetical protein